MTSGTMFLGLCKGSSPMMLVSVTALAVSSAASADVVQYSDRASWVAATGAVTTVGAPDIPNRPNGVAGYFASQGVASISMPGAPLWDGLAEHWGLPIGTCAFHAIEWYSIWNTIQFTAPINSVALDWLFHQPFEFELLNGPSGSAVGSGIFAWPPDGTYLPQFYGLTSTVDFDRIRIRSISNYPVAGGEGRSISFATIVPSPAAGITFVVGFPSMLRRRRR